MANSSSAVLAQRNEPRGGLDFFPTPPFVIRALFKYIIKNIKRHQKIYEPACGRGDMSKVMKEFVDVVISSDIGDYGFGKVVDYLSTDYQGSENPTQDWVITNPPFSHALDFTLKALDALYDPRNPEGGSGGVAIFERVQWLETVGRYEKLFKKYPPTKIVIFSERVPIVAGHLDPTASSATAYCWIVWEARKKKKPRAPITIFDWVPPCRKDLTRPGDYEGQEEKIKLKHGQIDIEDLIK